MFWNQSGMYLITLRPAGPIAVYITPKYTLNTFDVCEKRQGKLDAAT